MNKNEKDFMDQLKDLDDISVEKIAEKYPVLNENTKKRILKKCMEKGGFSAEIEHDGKEEIIISGTERYNRNPWYKFVASAAALVLAVGGITSVFMLNRNIVGNDSSETGKTSAVRIYDSSSNSESEQTTVTASDNNHTASDYDSANANEHSGIIVSGSSQTSSTVTGYVGESPVNNSNNSVSQNSTTTTPAHSTTPASQLQKTYLNNLYYVEIAGVSGYCGEITRGIHGYMGFEFMPDGTLTKYFFDETGNAIGSTIVKTNYEIVENKFSFGDKSGTIVNSNDTTSFTVQFDDGDIFNFSTKQPPFRKYYFIGTKPDTLNGTIWAKCFGNMDENYNYTDRRTIEFKEDGVSGTVYILSHPRNVTKSTITEIPFTYERNGDEITFYMESSAYAMVKAEIAYNPYDNIYALDVEYLEADEWGTTLWCFGQTDSLNDYHYNY